LQDGANQAESNSASRVIVLVQRQLAEDGITNRHHPHVIIDHLVK